MSMMRMIIADDHRCHHSHSHMQCLDIDDTSKAVSVAYRRQHTTMCLRYHLPISWPDTNIYESLISLFSRSLSLS